MSKIKLRLQHGADKILVPIVPTKTFADLKERVNERYHIEASGFIVDGYHIYLQDQICDMIENPKEEIVEVCCDEIEEVKESDHDEELTIDDQDASLDLVDDNAPSVKLEELRQTLSLENLEQTMKATSPITKYESTDDTVPKHVYLELYEQVIALQAELAQYRESSKSNLPTPPNTTRTLTIQALEEKARESAKKPYITIMMPKRNSVSETDHLSTMVEPDGSVRSSLDPMEHVTEGLEETSNQPRPPKSTDETEKKQQDREVPDEVEQTESKKKIEQHLNEEVAREMHDSESKVQDQDDEHGVSPKLGQNPKDIGQQINIETGASNNDAIQLTDEKEHVGVEEDNFEITIESEEVVKMALANESNKELSLSQQDAEVVEVEAKENELKSEEEREAEAKAAAERKKEEDEKIRKHTEHVRQKMQERLVKRKGPRTKLEKMQEKAKVLDAAANLKNQTLKSSVSKDSEQSGASGKVKKQSPRAAIAARMAERMKHRKEPRKTHLPPKPEPKPKAKKKKRSQSPQRLFIDGTMSPKELKRIKRLKIQLGDKLEIHGHKEGIVKYIGSTEFSKGVVFGLELCDGSLGENSGTVNGRAYFECREKRGIFVPSSEIRKKVKELRRESRRDVYRRRIVKIFENFNPEKVANVERLLDRYMGSEHDLYEQICKKYFVSPEKEYKP